MHRALVSLALLALVAACEVPTPMAPAEPIGEVPRWGEGFVQPTEQVPGGSMLGNGNQDAPPLNSPLGGPPANSNAPLPPGTQKPGDTGDWSGGDAAAGRGIFVAMCARCHGMSGEGGMIPGVGTVPALADPAYQGKVSDKEMARVIVLGKGAMPSFMRDLDRDKLSGVIAHIRTLRK